jgi:hypothetical protein
VPNQKFAKEAKRKPEEIKVSLGIRNCPWSSSYLGQCFLLEVLDQYPVSEEWRPELSPRARVQGHILIFTFPRCEGCCSCPPLWTEARPSAPGRSSRPWIKSAPAGPPSLLTLINIFRTCLKSSMCSHLTLG